MKEIKNYIESSVVKDINNGAKTTVYFATPVAREFGGILKRRITEAKWERKRQMAQRRSKLQTILNTK